MFLKNIKTNLLVIGDVIILYLSLAAALILRYGYADFNSSFNNHFWPFSLIFAIWILVFYLSDLYSPKSFKVSLENAKNFTGGILINIILSIIVFYAFGSFFQLAPKSNLLIFSFIFMIFDYGWRIFLSKYFSSKSWTQNLCLLGDSEAIGDLNKYLESNPQIGYRSLLWMKDELNKENFGSLFNSIVGQKIQIIAISSSFKKNPLITKMTYKLIPFHVDIIDFPDFYESIFRKVPIKELDENWLVEEIKNKKKLYDIFKRLTDVILAFLLIIMLWPLAIIITLLIKYTSPGKTIYRQTRVGRDEKNFTLYKFRTMRNDAENEGAKWAEKNDSRITPLGKILRKTHLDEMPQLWNILKGDISFVGPRPERPEFTSVLEKEIPYYEIRHIIKPGLTGWAQINYRYGASTEDAFEKLQYELYYMKKQSWIFDLLIVLKTIRMIFKNH